jgi:hypothetical protein
VHRLFLGLAALESGSHGAEYAAAVDDEGVNR